MDKSQRLVLLFGILIMPSFGASLRMDILGEVQVAESTGQTSAQMRAGLAAAESISFPHHFEMDSGHEVLVFKNESTGKTVGLKFVNAGETIEITPLLWRELAQGGLGEGQRFSWSSG